MADICANNAEAVGRTPLVKLNRLPGPETAVPAARKQIDRTLNLIETF
jgi:hypothetical protein